MKPLTSNCLAQRRKIFAMCSRFSAVQSIAICSSSGSSLTRLLFSGISSLLALFWKSFSKSEQPFKLCYRKPDLTPWNNFLHAPIKAGQVGRFLSEAAPSPKILLTGLFTVTTLLCGCANPGIVEIAPGIYDLSREDHGGIFGNASALRAGVIRDANAFAAKRGKVAIPIRSKSHPVGHMADWASFAYEFKLVDTNSPEASTLSSLEAEETVTPGTGSSLRPERYTITEYHIRAATNR